MISKELIRIIKVRNLEDLILTEKQINKAGFKTHIKDALNYYVIEVYAVSETAFNKET